MHSEATLFAVVPIQGSLLTRRPMARVVTFARRTVAHKCQSQFDKRTKYQSKYQTIFLSSMFVFDHFPPSPTFQATPVNAKWLREGFLKAIQLCLRLRIGALAHAGPPCGSFVFLNRFTSGRSSTRPLGNRRGYVMLANETLAVEIWFMYHYLINSYQAQSNEFLLSVCFRSKDTMSPATSLGAMFCSIRSLLGRATILFDNELVPLLPMVEESDHSIFPLAGDKIVGGSGQRNELEFWKHQWNCTLGDLNLNFDQILVAVALAKSHGFLRPFQHEANCGLWMCVWNPGRIVCHTCAIESMCHTTMIIIWNLNHLL